MYPINFKYEYLDHKKRTSASSDVKISVPLYQPDRFEISKPVVPDYVEEGQEVAVTMNYINKSKTIMSNVEAVVDGDVTTQTQVQTIGNVDAGKNGTIAFALTPNSTGEVDFTITVNYEDANGEAKTRVFPVTMDVQAQHRMIRVRMIRAWMTRRGQRWIPMVDRDRCSGRGRDCGADYSQKEKKGKGCEKGTGAVGQLG